MNDDISELSQSLLDNLVDYAIEYGIEKFSPSYNIKLTREECFKALKALKNRILYLENHQKES